MFGRRKLLDHHQLVAGRQPVVIEPLLAVEAAGLDHERVAFPAPLRIAHPARIEVVGELASVEVHLAPQVERFVDQHHQRVGLHDLERHRRLVDLRHALRQAVGVGLVVAEKAGGARGVNLLRARRHRHVIDSDIGREILEVAVVRRVDAAQIGFARGGARCRAPTGSACRRGRPARGSAGCATERRPGVRGGASWPAWQAKCRMTGHCMCAHFFAASPSPDQGAKVHLHKAARQLL